MKFVTVPFYDELEPKNVIEKMNLEKDYGLIWNSLKNFMPELETKKVPKDRKFFFDMLNTLKPHVVDRMVHNAKEELIIKSKIDDEITVIPELRGIFNDPLSLIGNRGRSILNYRKGHKSTKGKYNDRKKYELKFN